MNTAVITVSTIGDGYGEETYQTYLQPCTNEYVDSPMLLDGICLRAPYFIGLGIYSLYMEVELYAAIR